MHLGRIKLLESLKVAEDSLLAAINAAEDAEPGSYGSLQEQRNLVMKASAAVYQRIMAISDDCLTQ